MGTPSATSGERTGRLTASSANRPLGLADASAGRAAHAAGGLDRSRDGRIATVAPRASDRSRSGRPPAGRTQASSGRGRPTDLGLAGAIRLGLDRPASAHRARTIISYTPRTAARGG